MDKSNNRLAFEKSPYLLQHSDNPVHWYPWGDEAFERAKKENKLILVSIGYSSCHWCHVMAHETFSDTDVASYMNQHYINIKVDREEHPDIDQVYMNAVQIINRSGGWPLNCFTLPDGKPVFGGTYFSKENWLNVLESLNATWTNERGRVVEVAEELARSIAISEVITSKKKLDLTENRTIHDYSNHLKKLFDNRNGGIKGAPKFPMPGLLEFLLEYGYYYPDQEVLNHVFQTLDKIALGGIYDHLGGGFARYSVDEAWQIPHFEKMLYDNAQLISLYSKAYRIRPNDLYKMAVNQSVTYLLEEMRSADGGFYTAYDADSEGEEGAYYTWSKKEVEGILQEDAELFCSAYNISVLGNFDGKNVLSRSTTNEQLGCIFSTEAEAIEKHLNYLRKVMLQQRRGRIKPGLDDKVIVSWNSMTISALVDAYVTFRDSSYIEAAIACAMYIEDNHLEGSRLKRIRCKGKSYVDGLLDDYAFLAKAYTSLYRATLNKKWLAKAETLVKVAIDEFYDKESGMFFYAPKNGLSLIVRKMDLTDGVISSSGSVMAQLLFEISILSENDNYMQLSTQMLANVSEYFKHGGPYVYGWAKLKFAYMMPVANLSFSNDKGVNEIYLNSIGRSIYPTIKLSIKPKEESNDESVLLCIDKTCSKLSKDSDEIANEINSIRLS